MRPLDVLVADDEKGIRDLLKDALTRQGHSVTCASNGVEALAQVAARDLDTVFLDIRMPNGDGLTVLREIKAMRPGLPVVMITGCGDQVVKGEALSGGCCACLIKPFSTRDVLGMLDVVESLLDEAA